ncbi:MAG: DUF2953 domain-containing protein [Clostridia bacterium]|nr:DUF2953 domain-containing protein [Clostridia bacterium]
MPIPLIVLGAVILLVILLCLLRIRVILTLDSEVKAVARVLCFRFSLYPRRKKIKWKQYSRKKAEKIARKQAKQEAKRAKKAKSHRKDGAPTEHNENQKATLPEKLRMVRALCAALFRKTHKHLRLHTARLHISVATGDAAKTAVLYGVVCQTLAYLLAMLDRITRLKAAEPDVAVTADFLGERSSADVRLVFSLRIGGAILILFSVILAYLKAKADRRQRRKQKAKKAAMAARAKAAQKG